MGKERKKAVNGNKVVNDVAQIKDDILEACRAHEEACRAFANIFYYKCGLNEADKEKIEDYINKPIPLEDSEHTEIYRIFAGSPEDPPSTKKHTLSDTSHNSSASSEHDTDTNQSKGKEKEEEKEEESGTKQTKNGSLPLTEGLTYFLSKSPNKKEQERFLHDEYVKEILALKDIQPVLLQDDVILYRGIRESLDGTIGKKLKKKRFTLEPVPVDSHGKEKWFHFKIHTPWWKTEKNTEGYSTTFQPGVAIKYSGAASECGGWVLVIRPPKGERMVPLGHYRGYGTALSEATFSSVPPEWIEKAVKIKKTGKTYTIEEIRKNKNFWNIKNSQEYTTNDIFSSFTPNKGTNPTFKDKLTVEQKIENLLTKVGNYFNRGGLIHYRYISQGSNLITETMNTNIQENLSTYEHYRKSEHTSKRKPRYKNKKLFEEKYTDKKIISNRITILLQDKKSLAFLTNEQWVGPKKIATIAAKLTEKTKKKIMTLCPNKREDKDRLTQIIADTIFPTAEKIDINQYSQLKTYLEKRKNPPVSIAETGKEKKDATNVSISREDLLISQAKIISKQDTIPIDEVLSSLEKNLEKVQDASPEHNKTPSNKMSYESSLDIFFISKKREASESTNTGENIHLTKNWRQNWFKIANQDVNEKPQSNKRQQAKERRHYRDKSGISSYDRETYKRIIKGEVLYPLRANYHQNVLSEEIPPKNPLIRPYTSRYHPDRKNKVSNRNRW